MAIAWANELNTGIDAIDDQHKRIVDYINQLDDAGRRHDRLGVGRVLDNLVDYTRSHFAFEESLQVEAGYKLAEPHKAIHDQFIKRVARYQDHHNAGEDVAEQVHVMLTAWLIHHIRRDDAAYVPAVQARLARLPEDKGETGWLSRALTRFFR